MEASEDLTKARAALLAGDPALALQLVNAIDDPGRHWIRALASATLHEPLATLLALRDVERAHALPAQALEDVALPFADAVLASEPTQAWIHLARAVLSPSTADLPEDPALLAWSTLTALAARTRVEQSARLHLRTAALARRLGYTADALDFARHAQEAALRDHDEASYLQASALLAALCLASDDPPLAQQVLTHAIRRLHLLGQSASLETLQSEAHKLLSLWSTETPRV